MTSQQALDPQKRFGFGKNWSRFLSCLDEERIRVAQDSLKEKLGCEDLSGKTFLDIGSGSGLFSLSAHLLGARVFSFDYDLDAVHCTQYLKEKYGRKDLEWSVERGSVLDQDFLKKFGSVDILYSWGVLHHTGHMYKAFENVSSMVKKKGTLFISIYNDQGRKSKIWTEIKKAYVTFPYLRGIIVVLCGIWLWKYRVLFGLIRHGNPFKHFSEYKKKRGMSACHDLVDWVGGYPFEVAKPEQVFDFFKSRGFELEKMKTCAGGGCNEFVFTKK